MAMVDTSAIVPRNVEGLKSDPPPIYLQRDAGRARELRRRSRSGVPIPGQRAEVRVNTNWDVFEYPPAKSYFLRVNDSWLVGRRRFAGRGAPRGKLPESVQQAARGRQLERGEGRATRQADRGSRAAHRVRQHGPGRADSRQRRADVHAGHRHQAPVGEQHRERRLPAGSNGTVVLSRRRPLVLGAEFNGPWQFATPTLPEDFKKIPLDHPRSRVLASVPGTRQAIEAVLLAQIPQTAQVNRKELKAPDVAYAGEPQFEPIPQTTVARAVNTDKDIIKVGDLYYMCVRGRVVQVDDAPTDRGRWPTRCRGRSTKSRSARRRTTSRT